MAPVIVEQHDFAYSEVRAEFADNTLDILALRFIRVISPLLHRHRCRREGSGRRHSVLFEVEDLNAVIPRLILSLDCRAECRKFQRQMGFVEYDPFLFSAHKRFEWNLRTAQTFLVTGCFIDEVALHDFTPLIELNYPITACQKARQNGISQGSFTVWDTIINVDFLSTKCGCPICTFLFYPMHAILRAETSQL